MIHCCSELTNVAVGNSPFSLNMILNWYDGELEGFLRCGGCAKTFRYMILAWDHLQDDRLFVLSEVAPESFLRVETFAAEFDTTPSTNSLILWGPGFEERRTEVEEMLDLIVRSAGPPLYLIECRSLMKQIKNWELTDHLLDTIRIRPSTSATPDEPIDPDDIKQWRSLRSS
jgi:hypothetical protein